MNLPFEGQAALVTGASRGLGRAIARRLAGDGAAVCVNYANSTQAAEELVKEIRAAGGRAISVRADIGDRAQVESMIERASGELGKIAILVNNAGVAWRATLESYEPSGMERMRRTNVDGLIHVTRAVLAGMKERRYGRIINITSIVKPTDIQVLLPAPNRDLTLVTCYPFYYVGHAPKRFIVHASRQPA